MASRPAVTLLITSVLCGVFGLELDAQPAGTFTATGSMVTPRQEHSATLLENGKVLIVGGFNTPLPSFAVLNAELYDPSTGTFSPTGNLTTPRAEQAATLLPDGKVLIVGGSVDGTAETYDPTTGGFTTVESIVGGYFSDCALSTWSTATLLNDGRVLITRGSAPGGTGVLSTAGIYDPLAGTFTATGDMVWVHAEPVATLLADGRVLIVEGRDFACEVSSGPPAPGTPLGPIPCGGSEVYDPATGTFSPTGFVSGDPWRGWPSSNLLANGQVLVAGGDGGNDFVISAQLYNPLAGGFTATANMSLSRTEHTGTLLPDGTVLIAGGASTDIGLTDTAEIYVPSAGTFVATGSMITRRGGFTATLLQDGSVLMAGGNNFGGASAEIYHPAATIAAPILFSLSGDGSGQGAIWNATTGQIVSASAPAATGDILSLYTTGLIEGGVIPPQVAIDGRMAQILYFGDAPGYSGYFQVNFVVPANPTPGAAVSVRLTYLDRPSNAVTIGVR